MLTAATGAAKGHAKDLENYLKARVKLIADGTAAIAADLLKRKITEEDAKFAFDVSNNFAHVLLIILVCCFSIIFRHKNIWSAAT